MNHWMEKIRINKKIFIGGAAAVLILAAVILFLLLSGGDKDGKSSTGIHTAGERITTKQAGEIE